MLYSPNNSGLKTFSKKVPSYGFDAAPLSATIGTAFTCSNTGYGSWTQIVSATALDSYGFIVTITGPGTFQSTDINRVVVKVGIDNSGGTSYSDLVTGMQCNWAGRYIYQQGRKCYFPIFVPAGSTLAVAGYDELALGTYRAVITLFQYPTSPETIRCASYSESIGESTNLGTLVSGANIGIGGTNANEGTWVSLGTTTKNNWHWQVVSTVANAGGAIGVDLAVGDATKKDIIIYRNIIPVYLATIFRDSWSTPVVMGAERYVPAGSTLYVRCATGLTVASGDVYVTAIGCGG